ncbi:phospho-sugar mutase [Cesiribacter andamanensis]|uniref:Phosphoglucomutase n=1 Tax=Cesiribacter andamanensis AMV16 TaxID=1279009 RepID=M7NYI0_9BACT|nr:phospho-sugar mutase [Cesiribacter andamanensis]EMR03449.1 Phosphoglucomutase [Cesiribacter andamanensis AMV16]
MEIKEKAKKWLNSPAVDADTKQQIQQWLDTNNEAELTEAFYKDLEFGTGGLRGIMGVGSNRMNKYTLGLATQGLANYLKKCYPNQPIKVAIAHDSRNNSRFFAETTADIFSANGIQVYLFEELRPTPLLSFAIRYLGCQSGVVLTASHNPKEYNGYKAYWSDGAQLVPPHDKNVILEVNKLTDISEVNFQKNPQYISLIGKEVDEAYMREVLKLSVSPEAIRAQSDLKIVFTPIHGTGITLVPEVLRRMGFGQVHVVQEQAEPNGNFPTVEYPNPEEAEALSLGLKKARELDADLLMGTDPDADRVGIAIKNKAGEWQLLNGNQTGALLLYYLLEAWKEKGKLNGRQYIVKTIVTTDLIDRMAEHYGVDCYNTLTGFKYIAGVLRELEGKQEFIAGGEESYGYLISDFVRDKDAVASCAMIAEMAAWARHNGKGLWELLQEMYQRFGYYQEILISVTKPGKSGAEEIQKMMQELRQDPPLQIAGSPLKQLMDYELGVCRHPQENREDPLDFPRSNVLQFLTEDGSKISARPSGTEPKIKFYVSVNTPVQPGESPSATQERLQDKVRQIVEDMKLK